MIANKFKRQMWERLLRVISSHRITYKIARYLFQTEKILNRKIRNLTLYREYRHLMLKRKFYSRINQLNPGEYLDTSHKPSLDVILLVVDSLRNSNLSSQGYCRETTPFLDLLETRFTAISAAPWTYPSVASILTGLYPHNHSAFLAGNTKDLTKYESYQKLRGDILTLPEMLFILGYRIYFGTAIAPAYWAVDARVIPKEYPPSARADHLLNDLVRWIAKEKGKRFFTYVHLADLHIPLNPPARFRNFFGDIKNISNINGWDFVTAKQRENDSEKFQDYKENRILLYDNLLRYIDCEIERLYDALKDMGLVDSTVFIVTSDHGEEFWDHAELQVGSFYHQRGVTGVTHGQSGFRELIEVPIIMSGPIPDRKSLHLVSTVDIVPTIVDLLGISHKMRFDGRNIFEAERERPLLSEAVSCGYEKKALIIGRYKLIYSKDDGIEWLFDLEKDPEEQHPIMDKEVTSVFVEKLHQMLREDEKRKVREVARRKSLLKASNI